MFLENGNTKIAFYSIKKYSSLAVPQKLKSQSYMIQ